MKIWFDYCDHYSDDSFGPEVKLGLYWFKHAKPNSRFKPWNGFTIIFYLIWKQIHITFVDDYKAYYKHISYRYSDRLKEKKNVD